jgi:hypothetical protein
MFLGYCVVFLSGSESVQVFNRLFMCSTIRSRPRRPLIVDCSDYKFLHIYQILYYAIYGHYILHLHYYGYQKTGILQNSSFYCDSISTLKIRTENKFSG